MGRLGYQDREPFRQGLEILSRKNIPIQSSHHLGGHPVGFRKCFQTIPGYRRVSHRRCAGMESTFSASRQNSGSVQRDVGKAIQGKIVFPDQNRPGVKFKGS